MDKVSAADHLKAYAEACATLRHYSNASLTGRSMTVVQSLVLLGAWSLAFANKAYVIELLIPPAGAVLAWMLQRFHRGYIGATAFFFTAAGRMEAQLFEEEFRPITTILLTSAKWFPSMTHTAASPESTAPPLSSRRRPRNPQRTSTASTSRATRQSLALPPVRLPRPRASRGHPPPHPHATPRPPQSETDASTPARVGRVLAACTDAPARAPGRHRDAQGHRIRKGGMARTVIAQPGGSWTGRLQQRGAA